MPLGMQPFSMHLDTNDILREARLPSKRERKSQQELALFNEEKEK